MNNAASKPFARSLNDRMIAGVMGGIAHRYGWSATLLRIIFVVVSIASAAFPGILVYPVSYTHLDVYKRQVYAPHYRRRQAD